MKSIQKLKLQLSNSCKRVNWAILLFPTIILFSPLPNSINRQDFFSVQAQNADHIQQLLQTKKCPNCDLRNADLKGIVLIEADLRGANLSHANLSNAVLIGSDFTEANLSNADLKQADLSATSFEKADLSDANLVSVDLEDTKFSQTNLSRANLSNIKIGRIGETNRRVNWSSLNMSGAILKNARFQNVDMKNINLSNANLDNASFNNTDLRGADLKKINLTNAYLGSNQFNDVNLLTDTDLTEANLTDANLLNSDITNTKIDGVIWKRARLSSPNLSQSTIKILIDAGAIIHSNKGDVTIVEAEYEKIKLNLFFNKKTASIIIQVSRDGETFKFEPNLKSLRSFIALNDVVIRDLDGDGKPEIVFTLYSGGMHCCTYSIIYRYEQSKQKYTFITHNWHDAGYGLRDLDGDRLPEFIGYDLRFAYHFSSFAASRFPIQIWQYRQGKLLDVTRNFPQVLKERAVRLIRPSYGLLSLQTDTNQAVISSIAVYMAEQYLLNQSQQGWKQVQESYKIDELAFTRIENFLKCTGYAPNPTKNKYLIRSIDQYSGLEGTHHRIFLSSDGRTLVTISGSDTIFHWIGHDTIQIWDLDTGKLLRTWQQQIGWDSEIIALSPDAQTLVVRNKDYIKFLDLSNNKFVKIQKNSTTTQFIKNIKFDNDNQLMGVGLERNTENSKQVILFSDILTGQKVRSIVWNLKENNQLEAISNDGNIGVSSESNIENGDTIKLWATNSVKLLHTFSVNVDDKFSKMSLNNEVLVTKNRDFSIKAWKVKTGELLISIPNYNGFIISNDGKVIVMSDLDSNIEVWKVP